MTVMLAQVRAGETLAAKLAEQADALPGADWVKAMRHAARERIAAAGLPSRRVEEWKYTDLRARFGEPLALVHAGTYDAQRLARALGSELSAVPAVTFVFLNGRLASWDHGPLHADDPNLSIDSLRKALEGTPGWVRDLLTSEAGEGTGDIVTALNTALVGDGAVVRIPDGKAPKVPLHLVYVSDTDEPAAVATRAVVALGKDARATIIESHIGLGAGPRQTNHVTQVALDAGADLEHVKLLAEDVGARHLSTWHVRLGAGAHYRAFQASEAPSLARNQLFLTYGGEGGTASFNAAFLARGSQHIDTTMVIDHAVPRCTSRELIKGVLDGEARGIFQGKVIVRPGAQKSDGKQMAQALMLSEAAEFDSKPELEIYADDVVCGHGSTAAELDADHMFYLMSRGIPERDARALLIEAFTAEALETIGHEGVREALVQRARRWLAASGG